MQLGSGCGKGFNASQSDTKLLFEGGQASVPPKVMKVNTGYAWLAAGHQLEERVSQTLK